MGNRTCKKHRCAERRWAGGSDGSGGGSPITYIFVELFQRDNFAGLLVIGCIYIVCLAVSVQYSRAEKARSEDDTL